MLSGGGACTCTRVHTQRAVARSTVAVKVEAETFHQRVRLPSPLCCRVLPCCGTLLWRDGNLRRRRRRQRWWCVLLVGCCTFTTVRVLCCGTYGWCGRCFSDLRCRSPLPNSRPRQHELHARDRVCGVFRSALLPRVARSLFLLLLAAVFLWITPARSVLVIQAVLFKF